jgi:hypothetical protein
MTTVYVVYDGAHEEVVSVHRSETGATERVLEKQREGVHPDALDLNYYEYTLED